MGNDYALSAGSAFRQMAKAEKALQAIDSRKANAQLPVIYKVVGDARDPRTGGAADDRRRDGRAEDAAEMAAAEPFRRYRPDHGGQAVSDRSLCDHHQPEKQRRGSGRQGEQRQATQDKSGIADRPYPLAADAVSVRVGAFESSACAVPNVSSR